MSVTITVSYGLADALTDLVVAQAGAEHSVSPALRELMDLLVRADDRPIVLVDDHGHPLGDTPPTEDTGPVDPFDWLAADPDTP